MRPMFLILADLTAALTVPTVARLTGVSEAMVYKWGQDPERSGKPPALTHVVKIENYAADIQIAAVQTLVDELCEHIIPPNRIALRKDAVADIRNKLEAWMRGEPAQIPLRETIMLCKRCDQPLQIFQSETGKFRYDCGGCR